MPGVLHRIAELALLGAGAEASYLERIDLAHNEVEVVATAGAAAPAVGARVPYPGSLAQEVVEHDEPEVVTPAEMARRPIGRILAAGPCAECIALVLPLISEGDALGALILLRRPEHPDLIRDEMARLRVLADMAAVALRRAFRLEEARRYAHALEESERRFRLLVESVEDYAIFMLDPDGHVVTWNRGAERIKGYSQEEILGRYFSIFYTEEDRKRGWPEEVLEMAARHGRFEDQRWRVRKDGSRFWASVIITAIRDEKGGLLGFAKVTRDLTERQRADKALRESDERFHQLAENVREVFWLFDADFAQILYISPAYEAIWGQPMEALYHDPASWLEAVHPDDRDRVLGFLEVLKKRKANLEYRIVHPSGEIRWVWVRGFVIRNEQGEVYRIGGVTEDITERKEAEERQSFLADASRVLGSSLDYQETLRSIAGLAVRRIADWCVVDVLEQGEIRRVGVAHVDPRKEEFARELVRRYPPDPNAPTGVAQVLRTGESQLLPEMPETQLRAVAGDEEHLKILRELGLRSAMLVPLVARGRTLGAISFVAAESGRSFGQDDLAFAEDLAGRAALAVDNARLYAEAEAARQRVTAILESITDAFCALDREWRLTYLNQRAERFFEALGLTRAELLGRSLWEALPEAVGSTFYHEYHRALETQEPVHFEEYFPPLDSWFEVHVYPSPAGLSVFFQDVTRRKYTERRESTQHAVTRVLAESSTSVQMIPKILQAVAEELGWAIGAFWRLDEAANVLRCDETWYVPEIEEKHANALTREFTFPPGKGLPGRVWASGQPAWITNVVQDRNFPRKAAASAADVHGAFGFPVRIGAETVGVIEFFSREVQEPDQALLEMMNAIGTDVGQFIRREAAEAAIRESEQRFRSLAENATEAIVTIDAEDHIHFANSAVEKVFGYTPEELQQLPFTTLIPERYRELHRAGIRRYLATGEKRLSWDGVELPGLHKSGREIPLEITFGEYSREGRRFFTGIARDVTERKRAEEGQRLLAEAGAILAASLDYRETLEGVARLAVSSLADFCLIDMLDEGGLHRLAAAHRDAAKAEIMRRARHYPPGPGSPLIRPLETGEPLLIAEITERDVDAMARTAEHGRQIEATGLRSLMAVPIVARGQMLGVITFAAAESGRTYVPEDLAIAAELTSRAGLAIDNARLYQEAARRAHKEAALRQAAHAVTATFSIDEVIREIAASSLEATGADGAFVNRIDLERSEVEVVAAAGEMIPAVGARTPYLGSLTELVIQRGEAVLVPSLAEATHSLPDGIMRSGGECSAMIVPLLDGGEVIGTLALTRRAERQGFRPDDVGRAQTFADLGALAFRKIHLLADSEQRREELEQVMESRARLIRGFSHDLRNPLGAADGYLQLVETGIITDPEKRELSIFRARRAIGSALGLINDLVELARAEAGQIDVAPEPVDVREVAREMTEEYRAQAEAKGLEVRCDLPDELPLIESDASRIRQILGNLISNAVKYTSDGRVDVTVEIRVRDGLAVADEWVAVDVADTGPGIAAEKQHLLFREFSRLESGATPGAGLGLAISQKVAEALGGHITAASKVGRGSTFTLWLPLNGVREGESGLAHSAR